MVKYSEISSNNIANIKNLFIEGTNRVTVTDTLAEGASIGVSFYAYAKDSGLGTPLFRAYNPNDGTHNYTAAQAEQQFLVSLGWDDEQFGWSVK